MRNRRDVRILKLDKHFPLCMDNGLEAIDKVRPLLIESLKHGYRLLLRRLGPKMQVNQGTKQCSVSHTGSSLSECSSMKNLNEDTDTQNNDRRIILEMDPDPEVIK